MSCGGLAEWRIGGVADWRGVAEWRSVGVIWSGVWHQGNEQWPSSDNKAPTRVKVRQTPRNESTINKSDVLQPSPLITLR